MLNNRITFARSMMLAALSSLCITANAQDLLRDIKVSGFLDLFYQYDFNRPKTGASVLWRQFDVTHNDFTIAQALISAVKAPTEKDPFGLTLMLTAGKNADIQNFGEPSGPDTYKYFQQAYVTYAPKNGPTVDFGKFLAWVGYESPLSINNDLYSIDFLFYLIQPNYHTGFRTTYAIPKTPLTVAAYLVNGWNEVEDSNAGKSYGATVSGTFFGGRTGVTLNYYGGNEGSSDTNGFFGPFAAGTAPGMTNVQLGDLVVTHQLTPSVKLAFNGDYASGSGVNSGDPSGHVYGAAGYVTAKLTPSLSGTVRYDQASDPDGLRLSPGARFTSVTAGLSFAASASATFKLEFRYDRSNKNVFEDHGGGMTDSRTTLTFAHIYKF